MCSGVDSEMLVVEMIGITVVSFEISEIEDVGVAIDSSLIISDSFLVNMSVIC